MLQQHVVFPKRNLKFVHQKFRASYLQNMSGNQMMGMPYNRTMTQTRRDFSNQVRLSQGSQAISQGQKEIKVCHSPEKNNKLDTIIEDSDYYQIKSLSKCKKSCESLKTVCTSTESLLSAKTNSSKSSSNETGIPKIEKTERNFIKNKNSNHSYFNKFNTPTENSNLENTLILTLRIKVGPNDYRVFNLKKYDDLFDALQKFFSLNQIKQELIKPIVNKIFIALNQIFFLMNNKIGIYDKDYLNSLYKVWMKNKGKIPKKNRHNSVDVPKVRKSFKNNKSFTDGFTGVNNISKKEEKKGKVCNTF
ncbi:MAG: hypothetical protein MJ252_22930 [archaeon]|nr:hypothetical protein [archaeon]